MLRLSRCSRPLASQRWMTALGRERGWLVLRSHDAYLPRLLLLLLQLALELLLNPLGLRPRSCCRCEKRSGTTSELDCMQRLPARIGI